MPPKKLRSIGLTGEIREEPKKKTSKPRSIEHTVFLNMVRERDRIWYKEGLFRQFLKQRYE